MYVLSPAGAFNTQTLFPRYKIQFAKYSKRFGWYARWWYDIPHTKVQWKVPISNRCEILLSYQGKSIKVSTLKEFSTLSHCDQFGCHYLTFILPQHRENRDSHLQDESSNPIYNLTVFLLQQTRGQRRKSRRMLTAHIHDQMNNTQQTSMPQNEKWASMKKKHITHQCCTKSSWWKRPLNSLAHQTDVDRRLWMCEAEARLNTT
jgi:hypothetical protein